jgi:hypothetical protein
MKLFLLGLMDISQKWTMPVQNWKAALNRFTIMFQGADAHPLTQIPFTQKILTPSILKT